MGQSVKNLRNRDDHSLDKVDKDLITELGHQLNTIDRYNRYIINSAHVESFQAFWKKLRKQDMENIRTLKKFVRDEMTRIEI